MIAVCVESSPRHILSVISSIAISCIFQPHICSFCLCCSKLSLLKDVILGAETLLSLMLRGSQCSSVFTENSNIMTNAIVSKYEVLKQTDANSVEKVFWYSSDVIVISINTSRYGEHIISYRRWTNNLFQVALLAHTVSHMCRISSRMIFLLFEPNTLL